MNNSSLIDLKAELLRKQQQFRKDKSSSSAAGPIKPKPKQKKSDFWSESNAGVRERSQRDLEAKTEEDSAIAKSRKQLEAKAKLYEEMSSGKVIPEEDGSKLFLVDFEQKSINKISEDRLKEEEDFRQQEDREDDEDKKMLFLKEKVPKATNPEEEWVDYTDSLGRSRRCLKKDLPDLMDMDKNLKNKTGESSSALPDLMSNDMYRERLRKQWEEEEQEALEGPVGPLHYANVQHDEIRDHGVGYYQFDKKDEARSKQLEDLQKLREQTKDKRAANQRLKEKRKAMLKSRLAKVRHRKLVREGKDPLEALDPDNSEGDSDEDIIGPRPEEQEATLLTRDESLRRDAPIREWDKGKDDLKEFIRKQKQHSEESWKDKMREERDSEFAPPSIYGDSGPARPPGRRAGTPPARRDGTQRNNEFAPPPSYGRSRPTPPQSRPDVVGSTLSALRAETERAADDTEGSSPAPGVSEIPVPLPGSLPEGFTLPDTSVPPPMYSGPVPQAQYWQQHPPPPYGNLESSAQQSSWQPGPWPSQHNNAQETVHQQSLVTEAHVTALNTATELSVSSTVSTAMPVSSTGPAPTSARAAPSTTSVPAARHPSVSVPAALAHLQTPAAPDPSEPQTTPDPSEPPAPQPAHYSSEPMKPQPKKPRYERVDLHTLPMTLPVPPTEATTIPEYPSQEQVFASNKDPKKPLNEQQAIKGWSRQFDQSKGGLKPANIPFVSPFVQNVDHKQEKEEDVKFDPSQPPPSTS